MSAHTLPKRADPKLLHGLLYSALLHAVALAGLAILVARVATPVDVPLDVTWIRPIVPPPEIRPDAGGSGPPPKPAAPPRRIVPPKPVVKPVAPPKPRPAINPFAKEKAPVAPAPPPPAPATASARITEDEYVDFSTLAGMAGGTGKGIGRGRGRGIGDGVGEGIAPRRPVIRLARSMYQPHKEDLRVYDRMFWHVVDHWDVPLSYKGRSDLVTTINVRFDKDGNILKFKFIRKSGDPAFDETVMRAIVASNPLPEPTREFYQRFYDSGIDFVVEPREMFYYAWPDPYAKKKRRLGF